MVAKNQSVAYFYDPDVGNFHYSPGHPMKPHRIRMTHSLVMSYELYKHMSTYRAAPATKREMTQFHTDDYVEFLDKVMPETAYKYQKELAKYNLEDDCPVFDGMFDFFSLSAGSSMEGAARLNRGFSDICINWSGGLHHAKKSEASGFCYINDIVLAILELLRHHARVLYIDIDVHHGDGVEEAFYTTDRVMTCSFHKYGEYFPGTGDLRDIGESKGKYYSVNFPLKENISDQNYESIFKPVIQSIVEWYQPGAIVLQCGADSLSGDKLGCFNLSADGHASCVSYVKSFGLPLLVLGGGGYSIRNVARAWAYETGILVGAEMSRTLPMNDYIDYYGPDYTLAVPSRNVDDSNTTEYLERIKNQVLQNLERTKFAPSVQMHSVPLTPLVDRDLDLERDEDEDLEASKDVRMTEAMVDREVVDVNDLYDYDSLGQSGNLNRDSSNKLINENGFENGTIPAYSMREAPSVLGPLGKKTFPKTATTDSEGKTTMENATTETQSAELACKPSNGDSKVSVGQSTNPGSDLAPSGQTVNNSKPLDFNTANHSSAYTSTSLESKFTLVLPLQETAIDTAADKSEAEKQSNEQPLPPLEKEPLAPNDPNEEIITERPNDAKDADEPSRVSQEAMEIDTQAQNIDSAAEKEISSSELSKQDPTLITEAPTTTPDKPGEQITIRTTESGSTTTNTGIYSGTQPLLQPHLASLGTKEMINSMDVDLESAQQQKVEVDPTINSISSAGEANIDPMPKANEFVKKNSESELENETKVNDKNKSKSESLAEQEANSNSGASSGASSGDVNGNNQTSDLEQSRPALAKDTRPALAKDTRPAALDSLKLSVTATDSDIVGADVKLRPDKISQGSNAMNVDLPTSSKESGEISKS